MPLPELKFDAIPPGRGKDSQRRRDFSSDSLDQAWAGLRNLWTYLRGYIELPLITISGTYLVLARKTSDDAATQGSILPWQCIKLPNRIVRIYPVGVYDGTGNRVQPTWLGNPVPMEGSVDIPLPADITFGLIYLECTVSDTNELHGIVTAAAIKVGLASGDLNEKVGGKVKFALCYYNFIPNNDCTIDPVRSFAFTARRYGPPGSTAWDLTPTG